MCSQHDTAVVGHIRRIRPTLSSAVVGVSSRGCHTLNRWSISICREAAQGRGAGGWQPPRPMVDVLVEVTGGSEESSSTLLELTSSSQPLIQGRPCSVNSGSILWLTSCAVSEHSPLVPRSRRPVQHPFDLSTPTRPHILPLPLLLTIAPISPSFLPSCSPPILVPMPSESSHIELTSFVCVDE